jgi:hypothetical protein
MTIYGGADGFYLFAMEQTGDTSMRSRKMVKPLIPPKHPQVTYEYQTRSDWNGKPEYLLIQRGHPALPGHFKRKKVTKTKLYFSAVANGMFAISPLTTPEYDHDVTNSRVLANIFQQNVNLTQAIDAEFSESKATNGAIDSALRYGDILLLVTLAETSKTLTMLKQVFLSLYKLVFSIYDAVKSLKPKEAYLVASDLWLQYRYGWRPLFLELETLYAIFTDKKAFDIRSAYGTVKHSSLELGFPVNATTSIDGVLVDACHTVTLKEVTHKVGFNYFNKVDTANVDGFRLLGLDIKSLLQTAHELVPFSFILDMFLNVGNTLKTFDYKSNVSPINGYKTSRYICDVTTVAKTSTGITRNGAVWVIEPWQRNYDFADEVSRNVNYYARSHYRGLSPMKYLPVPVYEPEWFRELNVGDYEIGALVYPLGYKGAVYKRGVYHIVYQTVNNVFTKIETLVDEDSIVLVHDQHIYRSLAWFVKKEYTYTVNGKSYTFSKYVVFPYPDELRTRFFPHHRADRLFDQVANDNAAYKALSSIFDNGGSFSTVPGGNTQRYLENIGIYESKWTANYAGVKLRRNMPHSFDPDLPRYMLPYCTSAAGSIFYITFDTEKTFSGEYLTRTPKAIFDFNLVGELDLSKAQIADLTIFSERLVSFLRK